MTNVFKFIQIQQNRIIRITAAVVSRVAVPCGTAPTKFNRKYITLVTLFGKNLLLCTLKDKIMTSS